MGKLLELPQRVGIGSIIGSCPNCDDEVIVIDYGTEDPADDEWLGSCCGCMGMSYWFLEKGQWICTTADDLEVCPAEVVELFPKGA